MAMQESCNQWRFDRAGRRLSDTSQNLTPLRRAWCEARSGLMAGRLLSGVKAEYLKYWLPLYVIFLMHRSYLSTGSPYLPESDSSKFFSGPLGCLPENLGKSGDYL